MAMDGAGLDRCLLYETDRWYSKNDMFKPLLIPMSELLNNDHLLNLAKIESGEDWDSNTKVIKTVSVCNVHWIYFKTWAFGYDFDLRSFYSEDMSNGDSISVINQYSLFEYLFANHFDVFNLIPSGLALNKLEYI